MKFFAVTVLVALCGVASAINLNLAYGGAYNGLLAKQVGSVLLNGGGALGYGYAGGPAYGLAGGLAAPAVAVAAPAIAAAPAFAAAPAIAAAPALAVARHHGPILTAVHSQRHLQLVDVPSTGGVGAPQAIVIGPSIQPIDIEFQSQSSPVSVRQVHIPGTANPPQFAKHEEEPDLLRQEVVKPVVHEVNEVIQPFRKITQEVRPVQEEVSQLLTRGQQVPVPAPVATVAAAAPVAVAAPVAAAPVAVAAAPVAVAAAPVAAAPVAVAAAPVAAAPIALGGLAAGGFVKGGFATGFAAPVGFAGYGHAGLHRLPVAAKIARF